MTISKFTADGRIDQSMPTHWSNSLYNIFRDIALRFQQANTDITNVSGGGGLPTVTGFSARRTTDQTSGTTIVWDAESTSASFDSGVYNNSTGTFTASVAGIWVPSAQFRVTNSGGEGSPVFVEVEMTLNGSTTSCYDSFVVGDDYTFHLTPGPMKLAANDTLIVKRSGGGSWSSAVRVSPEAPENHGFGAFFIGAAP